MMTWLRKLWRTRLHRRRENREDRLRTLLDERRRLDDMIACYKEFGFDPLIPECRTRRADLDREIRRCLGEARPREQNVS